MCKLESKDLRLLKLKQHKITMAVFFLNVSNCSEINYGEFSRHSFYLISIRN